MLHQENSIKELIKLYPYINEASRCAGRDPIFKSTSRVISATNELAIPEDKAGFENLVKNLFILFYESSGCGKRLPSDIDEERIIQKIKELRNHFEHDREHGKDVDVKRKFRNVGDIYEYLIGKRFPSTQEDWVNAGHALIRKLVDLSNKILKDLESPKKPAIELSETERKMLEEFFEHEMTIFPNKKEKFRITKKYGEFSHGSACVLFLPTFRFSPPAEFGNTNSAVYIASEAPRADFEGFKRFVRKIEQKWNNESNYEFAPSSELFPWSISGDGYVVYGSGSKNLIEALEHYYKLRVSVSIVLQGIFGVGSTDTFFIVIGSDIKGGWFSYNFIDFYLSSIPIEWNWIKSINNSLDELSRVNMKASNYTLKSYRYFVWEGIGNIPIDKDIIGGIGRNGLKHSKRDWDTFDGLILSRDKLDIKYVLDEESSWKLPYYEPSCPKDYLDEFVVSVTNHPPDVDEIQTGKLVGINRPSIYVLCFEGKGWDIFAINIWGTSKFR